MFCFSNINNEKKAQSIQAEINYKASTQMFKKSKNRLKMKTAIYSCF